MLWRLDFETAHLSYRPSIQIFFAARSSPEFKCYLCHTFGADAAKWLKIPRNSLVNLILCLICLLVSETQPSLKPAPWQLQSWRWNDRNTLQLASHWSLSTFCWLSSGTKSPPHKSCAYNSNLIAKWTPGQTQHPRFVKPKMGGKLFFGALTSVCPCYPPGPCRGSSMMKSLGTKVKHFAGEATPLHEAHGVSWNW